MPASWGWLWLQQHGRKRTYFLWVFNINAPSHVFSPFKGYHLGYRRLPPVTPICPIANDCRMMTMIPCPLEKLEREKKASVLNQNIRNCTPFDSHLSGKVIASTFFFSFPFLLLSNEAGNATAASIFVVHWSYLRSANRCCCWGLK